MNFADTLPGLAGLGITPLEGRLASAAIVTSLFALWAYRLRAVNASGAVAGAAASFCLYGAFGVSGFALLGVVFVITVATTRLGRERKRRLQIGEPGRGRNAWQVLANLSVAAGLSVAAALHPPHPQLTLAWMGALAEAAADTAASEAGKALGIRVYLVTNFEPAEVGAEGAISVIGTLSGIAAAVVVAVAAVGVQLLPWRLCPAVAIAGVLGAVVDSLLGATLQRAGRLNNNAVNLLSTIAAAAIAGMFQLS